MNNDAPNIFDEIVEAESRLNSNQDSAAPAGINDKTPRLLFNQREPAYVLQAERPEHRVIIMLKAAGKTNREIAAAIGKSDVHVGTIVKQPWAVEQILKEIEDAGREPVLELMQVTAEEALNTVINTMRHADSLKDRAQAANSILDRVFGKASQPITLTQKKAEDMSDDELARLAAKAQKN